MARGTFTALLLTVLILLPAYAVIAQPDGGPRKADAVAGDLPEPAPDGERAFRAVSFINKTASPITIDGNWNAAEWARAKCIDLSGTRQCLFYIAFDNTRLYIGLDVINDATQDTLTTEQEILQMAFDGDNDGQITYTNPTGDPWDVIEPNTASGPCVDRWVQITGWNTNAAGWLNIDGITGQPTLWYRAGENSDSMRAGFAGHRFYEYSMAYNPDLGLSAGVNSVFGMNLLCNDGKGDTNPATFDTRGRLPANWGGITGPWTQFALAQAPEAVVTAPLKGQTFYLDEEVQFDASDSTDDNVAALTYSWAFDDGGIATGKTAPHKFATAGQHNVTLEVTDTDALKNLTRINIFLKERNAPPTIDAFTPATDPVVNETDNITFSVDVGDSNLDVGDLLVINWSIDGVQKKSDRGVVASNYLVATHFDGSLSAGKYLVEVLVQDSYDGGSPAVIRQWNLTVKNRNRAPVLTTFAPVDAELVTDERTGVSFSIQKMDPDGDKLTVSWTIDNQSIAQAKNSDTWFYQPDFNSSGSHLIRASVADNLTKTDKSWRVSVLNINRAPLIESFLPASPSMTVAEGKDVQFGIVRSDPDGDTTTIRWFVGTDEKTLTAGGTFTFKTAFEGDNSAEFSPYDVRVEVVDILGQKTQKVWEITVENVNRVPVPVMLSPVEGSEYRAGESIRFDASASFDPDQADNGSLSFTWDFGDGKTSSGALAQHRFDRAGSYRAAITVRDAAAATVAAVNITIRVPRLRVETITFDREAKITEGDIITITAFVENLGDASANEVKLKFLVDRLMPAPGSLEAIAPGEKREFVWKWTAVKGNHSLTVAIEPASNVLQDNNGSLSRYINVIARNGGGGGNGNGGSGPVFVYILVAIVLICTVAGTVTFIAMRKKKSHPKSAAFPPGPAYRQEPAPSGEGGRAPPALATSPSYEPSMMPAPPSCPRCGGPSPAMGLDCQSCEATHDVETKLGSLQSIMKHGVIVPSGEQMVANARNALAQGDFAMARKLASNAVRAATRSRDEHSSAEDALQEADAAMADGRRRGVNIGPADTMLQEAREHFREGRYLEARKVSQAVSPLVPEGSSLAACRSCGEGVEPGWKVCPSCNSSLAPRPPEPKNPKCPTCGEPVLDDWRVCPTCNSSLIEEPVHGGAKTTGLICLACGSPVEKEWRLCPDCGSTLGAPSEPLPARKERAIAPRCPSCRKEVDSDWRMCPFCDSPIEQKRELPHREVLEAPGLSAAERVHKGMDAAKLRADKLECRGEDVSKVRGVLELAHTFNNAGNAAKADRYLHKAIGMMDAMR